MDLRQRYAHPGEIRATVKGTLPLGQDYSELGLGASITLPDQWAALAGALATDADPSNANPAMRWDIHDEMVDENGNAVAAPVGSGVGGRSDPLHDAVVNLAVAGSTLRWSAHVERRCTLHAHPHPDAACIAPAERLPDGRPVRPELRRADPASRRTPGRGRRPDAGCPDRLRDRCEHEPPHLD